MEEIARSQRANRVTWTEEQRLSSKLALDLVMLAPGMIGYEEAQLAYERNGGKHLERLMGHPLPPPAAITRFKPPAEMEESEYPF